MNVQLIGLGNVGKNLVALIEEKQKVLESLPVSLRLISVSDSEGTAVDEKGLNLRQILKQKDAGWKGSSQYQRGYSASDSLRNMESDVVVELSPSTPSGEPGLSHIKMALTLKKHVVTANKGPLVVAYQGLMKLANRNHVKILYEATVAAHLPVFCLVGSCFKVDELEGLQGILNATTNFIIGEMERGENFQDALNQARKEGWAETECSDDVDGIDAARKVVILANALFRQDARFEDVKLKGIRGIENMVKKAQTSGKKVKLICEILRRGKNVKMSVEPKLIPLDDPLVTVSRGDMGLKFNFKTSQQVFVSAQFSGPKQTAYAVLNDILKLSSIADAC